MVSQERMNVRQIVMAVGMSGRPEYYSGRGATSSDLNDAILEETFRQVEQEHGQRAAQQYVDMVAAIPVLTATDYLVTLYRLESNGWTWDRRLLGDERGIAFGSESFGSDRDPAYIETVVWSTVASAIGRERGVDFTELIRGEFLKRHRNQDPR